MDLSNRDERGNLSGWRRALSDHFREVRERDTRWILQFNVGRLNRWLFPLLVALISLEFADVMLTLAALSVGPPLVELNPIASALFQRQFWGFVFALGLKYIPVLLIAYCVLIGDWPTRPVRIRVLKLGVLVALIASVILSATIVTNDAFNLFAYVHQSVG